MQLLFLQLLAVFVDFWVCSSWTRFLTSRCCACQGGRCFLRAVHRRGETSLCSCSDVFAVLDTVVDMPVASNDWCFGLTEQKTVEFRSCSAVKVVDVSVYAVHRRLWTSLCSCSDVWSLAGGASDSVHRQSWWTFQLQRQGASSRVLWWRCKAGHFSRSSGSSRS